MKAPKTDYHLINLMAKPWVVRMHQPGWAPTFLSWHRSEAAAERALARWRKIKRPGTFLEIVHMR